MAIDTRQLEPTPGWCERAREILARDECMPYGAPLCLEYDRAAKPTTPEPLPHEFHNPKIWGARECAHCRSVIAVDRAEDPCPARQSSAESVKPEPDEDTETDPVLQ